MIEGRTDEYDTYRNEHPEIFPPLRSEVGDEWRGEYAYKKVQWYLVQKLKRIPSHSEIDKFLFAIKKFGDDHNTFDTSFSNDESKFYDSIINSLAKTAS